MTVDHKISYRLFDARIENLRLVPRHVQGHNKVRNNKNLDRYKGVYFDGHSFRVVIGKDYYGTFETEEEAAAKANGIFFELYGDFACLNEIDFSRRTTKDNRLPEIKLNRKYIQSIKHRKELDYVIRMLGANTKAGGKYNFRETKTRDISIVKAEILEEYFPLHSYNEAEDKSMDDIQPKTIWQPIPEEILKEHEKKINPPIEIPQIIVKPITDEEIEGMKTIPEIRTFMLSRKLNAQDGGPYNLWVDTKDTNNFSVNGTNKKSIIRQLLFIYFPTDFMLSQQMDRAVFYAGAEIILIHDKTPNFRIHNPDIDIERLRHFIVYFWPLMFPTYGDSAY
jgi:hypothetical protein